MDMVMKLHQHLNGLILFTTLRGLNTFDVTIPLVGGNSRDYY